jgi:hypothetical protein
VLRALTKVIDRAEEGVAPAAEAVATGP